MADRGRGPDHYDCHCRRGCSDDAPGGQHSRRAFDPYPPGGGRRAMAARLPVWASSARPSPDRRDYYLRDVLGGVRLLDAARMRALLAGAAIASERFLGVPKSVIAIRR